MLGSSEVIDHPLPPPPPPLIGGGHVSNNNNAAQNNIYSNGNFAQQSTNNTTINTPISSFRWDPSNIRITSLAVEKTLEPLVTQITTLVNKTGLSNQPKGQSKKAEVLVATMERAIEIFILKGQEIAAESTTMFNELNAAIEDIRTTGHHMSMMSRKFVEDPCSSSNRADIVKAARPLLLAVTRLLIVADMVDVQRLLDSLKMVENDLVNLKNASSQQEVLDSKNSLWNNTDKLISEVDMRQPKDERSRFQLAAARAILKKNRTLLLTASKVYVRHPEIAETKKNRDFAFAQYCEAVNKINDVAQDKCIYANDFEINSLEDNLKNIGKLALALDAFDRDIAIDPYVYVESEMRPRLEASLERIITASAAVADFVCALKDDCRFCRSDKLQERQDLFVDKCNSVRQALQDLLSEYMTNAGSNEPSEGLNRALEQMFKKTRDLRRHLRQAAVDHVSYRFLAEQTLVSSLVDAAKGGDEMSVEEYAQALRKNAKMLMDVAYLNCCMSTNEIGVDRVNHSIGQLERLSSQVVNAAKILAARTNSKAAAENLEEFQARWSDQVQDLMDALHKIIMIDDLLALSELHTREDKIDGFMALQQDDKETFIRVGASLSNRFSSLCKAVESEMNNYEKCPYTESVLKANAAMKKSKDTFDRFYQNILRTFGDKNRSDMNKADYERTTNELIINLKQVRYAIKIYDELDSETEADYEDNTYETRSKSSIHTDIDEFPGVAGISNTRDAYRFISDEDKEKIAIYVENFRTEKNRFDQEVGKWDDNGNEIIAMAKKMCKIMMDMTDFTRGRGPLKTTMDVINAAKKISEYGSELDKIAGLIAEQSPESETKRDLQGYLKEIALYCHQLNITSKVKAEVQNISGNLIVSGLDSATSLIQAAKNLMNAVVSTVKASWVASTMYNQRLNGQAPQQTIVKWEVKVPEKKPLVRKEKSGEAWSRIQRAPRKRNIAPLKILNEFSNS
jgi:catenin alpha